MKCCKLDFKHLLTEIECLNVLKTKILYLQIMLVKILGSILVQMIAGKNKYRIVNQHYPV